MGNYLDETDVDQLCDQGDVEHEAGRWTQASTHYERALEFGAAQLSPERRIYVRMALAVCFFILGSYEDVVKYDRATLRILEAEPEYGTNHKDIVDTRYRLARALVDSASKSDRRRSENWEEAVTFYKENIRVAGKEASLEARKGLASVYFKLRQYSEAKDIYGQLLNEEEPNFLDGEDDESLELKHEYAAVQYHLKRYKKSKRLFSQIEETISSLPRSRKRKLEKMSQDVDKYLAACFEATLDLDRGVARIMAASKERKDSPLAPVKQSSAKDAPRQPRPSSPIPLAVNKKTSGSKQHAGPTDDAAASVTPKRRTASTHTELPEQDSKGTAPSTGKRFSKIASSPSSAETSNSPPTLSVPSSVTPRTRRSNSDHSVTRSREAIETEVPVARSRSAHSQSRSKHASDSESRPKSAVSLPPENKSSRSQSRSNTIDSEPTSKSRQKPSGSKSKPIHASDSESRPKSAAPRRPEKNSNLKHISDLESTPKSAESLHHKKRPLHSLSKLTDSSDSESKSSHSTPRSDSKTKRASDSTTEPSCSPKKIIPPSDSSLQLSRSKSESTAASSSKTKSIRSGSESKLSADSKTKPSHSASTSPSDSESKSSHSPKVISASKSRSSRPTPSSSSKSNPKAVASPSPEQTISKDKPSRKEDPRDKSESLRASELRRSRSVSAPSTSKTSSAKSAGAIGSPDRTSKRSRANAQIPDVVISPPPTCRPPGSWPEDSSGLSTRGQEGKELAPSKSKDRRRSLDEDAFTSLASISNLPKLERSRSESCAPSETGNLYALPSGAAEVDNWFRDLRKHSHTLLYHDDPKNTRSQPVRVAIIDSGLAEDCDDAKVPMARQSRRKIRKGQFTYKDFTGDSPSCTDSRDDLHGTLCASFLLQVAPHAELYIANVVRRKKGGQEAAHVAKAIKWAIEHEVDIISMSFGWEFEKPEVSRQIDLARGKGILLFAAASNDGPSAPESGVYPASHHSVYCIYSCSGSGERSGFNPRVPKNATGFMLPGEQIAVLEADLKPVAGSVRHDGTSFATPIAAGTAAMILDLVRHELKDSLEIERRLKDITGMTAVFQAMSTDEPVDRLYHVKPWKLLGESKPIESLTNPNISHKWYTLIRMLEHLRKFGAFAPLS
jgi:tetratricopeptide (TPR) repeat protein